MLLKNTSVTRVDITEKQWQVRGVNLTRERDILALRGSATSTAHDAASDQSQK